MLLKNENFTNEETDINNQLDQFAQSRASNYQIIRNFEENLISTAELVVVLDPEDNWIKISANFNNATFLFVSDKQLTLPDNGYQIKVTAIRILFFSWLRIRTGFKRLACWRDTA